MHRHIFHFLFDADEYELFIRNTIKLFRLSSEYKIWLNQCNRGTCAATGMTREEDNIDIEVHHYDYTLWNWVETILQFFDEEDLPVNSFYVGLILSEIHLRDCVSYIPLMHCIHKMIHSDYTSTIEKYPSILDGIEMRDSNKALEIINKYINLLSLQIRGGK